VKAHLRDVANAMAPNETRQRLAGFGVRVIDGAARFLDARSVAAGDFTIAARRFVIATGSSPALPVSAKSSRWIILMSRSPLPAIFASFFKYCRNKCPRSGP